MERLPFPSVDPRVPAGERGGRADSCVGELVELKISGKFGIEVAHSSSRSTRAGRRSYVANVTPARLNFPRRVPRLTKLTVSAAEPNLFSDAAPRAKFALNTRYNRESRLLATIYPRSNARQFAGTVTLTVAGLALVCHGVAEGERVVDNRERLSWPRGSLDIVFVRALLSFQRRQN